MLLLSSSSADPAGVGEKSKMLLHQQPAWLQCVFPGTDIHFDKIDESQNSPKHGHHTAKTTADWHLKANMATTLSLITAITTLE